MKASEEILNMVHAFPDEGRRQAVRELAAKVKALEEFVDNEVERKNADRIDGYDRDDLGESPDF